MRKSHRKALDQIAAGEMYVHCPRCDGATMISVCTDPGNDWKPSRWEYVACPLCLQTGAAEAEEAQRFIKEIADAEAALDEYEGGKSVRMVEKVYAKHCPDDLREAVDMISGDELEAEE